MSAALSLAEIQRLGFTHVLSIPDSESRYLHAAVEAAGGLHLIVPCREGESLAIAAGLWTGGAKPLVILQNTGLMEAGDALRGCGLGPSVPLRLLVGWRGFGGAQAGRLPIDSAYTYTEPLLAAWGLPYEVIHGDGDLGALAGMDATAEATSRPAVAVFAHGFRP
jgi:sulfopyruvate decarboxylase subunit alpha